MDKKKEEKLLKAVRELSRQPPNKRCADCTEKLPQYVNLTFNTFICTGESPPRHLTLQYVCVLLPRCSREPGISR
jgi:hypothetical protein